MSKIKITIHNCDKYVYRIDNIDDLERIYKFLYIKGQIEYNDIEYKMNQRTKQLNKEKEIFMRFNRLSKPHWSDGRILELWEFDDWKHSKPKEFVEFKDTTMSDLSLIYAINVFKIIISVIFVLLISIYVIPNLSPDDWAAIIIGSLFFGGIATNM